MGQTIVNIRMDAETKKQADQLFKALGLNMSTAINVFVKQSIMRGGIPFDIQLNPKTETLEAMEDANNHRNLIGPFENVKDMMESLDTED